MNLDERARRAAASVREQAGAADADAVLERIRGIRDRPRWLLPAGAATVAVALVIAVVAVVIPRVNTGPVIDPVVPGDQTPTDGPTAPPTTDSSEPASGAVSFEWQRVDTEAFRGPGDDRIRAVAQAAGDTTVAVGRRADGPGVWWRDPLRPADDPDAWRQVGTDLCGEASCELHDVAVTGDEFVVVGMLDGLPKIWRSEDGREWRRVDLQRRSGAIAGETELTAVVDRGSDGTVAFGAERLPDGGSRPVVFTSDDGETWSEAEVDFPFEEAGAHVIDAGGPGAVLQVGDGTSLLVETDGTWSTRDLEGDGFDIITTFVHAIAPADDGGLWMVGSVWTPDGQDGRVWHSTDGGTSWDPMPGDLGGPGDQHVTDVMLASGHRLAIGYETDEEGRSVPAAWALDEEDAWERIPGGDAFNDPGAMVDAVETDGHSAIAVGTAGGGGDPNQGAAPADAAVWTVQAVPEGEQAACSAAGETIVTVDYPPDVPDPVLDIREAVLEAAVACDYAALETLALEGARPFTYSFGEDGAPAAYWRREEQQGGQPMLELARLLEGPSATIRTEDLGTVHVWPPEYATNESYLGYRVGITEDGDWVFFVAGD